MSAQNGLVQRLWSYCNILRDDGLSYGDYLEQLTYLLFLKMADEQTKPPFSRPAIVPEGLDWPSLLARDGDELEVHYRHVLTELGRGSGMLGVVFRKAQNRIQDPGEAAPTGRRSDRSRDVARARRRRQGRRVRGAAREERGGREVGRGPVLHAAAVDPGDRRGDAAAAGDAICDPACGTGGLPPRRTRVDRAEASARPRPEAASALRRAARLGDRRQHGAAVRDEPPPARDRRRGGTRARSSSTTRSRPIPESASRWCSRTRRSGASRR